MVKKEKKELAQNESLWKPKYNGDCNSITITLTIAKIKLSNLYKY